MDTYLKNLSVEQQKLIMKHLELVIEANKTTNLTRIVDEEEAVLLHIEDSLAALEEMESAPQGIYGDLGSGAGFPGIPLAIATNRKTLLIDSRQKKMTAVQNMLEELGISEQVSTYAGRAELLARNRNGEFAVLTARALSKLSVLLELASPLLMNGGVLICYKSHVNQAEFDDAMRVQKLVGMTLKTDRSFMLGEYERRILSFEKTGKAKLRLPRQEGLAQKQPL